jgi:hypothetical protein
MSTIEVVWLWTSAAWQRARTRSDERGALTLEQVMWAAITLVGVVAVATIIWVKLRAKANSLDIQTPSSLP